MVGVGLGVHTGPVQAAVRRAGKQAGRGAGSGQGWVHMHGNEHLQVGKGVQRRGAGQPSC